MTNEQTTRDGPAPEDSTSQISREAPLKELDAMDDLALQLKDAVTSCGEVAKAGRPPVAFFFGFRPSVKQDDSVRQNFDSLIGVSSLARMFSAMNIITARKARDQGGSSDSVRDPSHFVTMINEEADAVVKAITSGPLASMYQQHNSGSTQTEEQLLKRSELHDFVLPRIFGGLRAIGKDHMKDLDDVLTRFTSTLRSFKADKTGSSDGSDQQLKFAVLIHYVNTTDVTGDGTVIICDPMTRLVSISVRVQDWAHALDKPSKVDLRRRNEKVPFKMTTTTLELRLNQNNYLAAKPKFEQALKLMVDKDAELMKIVENGGLLGYGHETCNIFTAQEE
ncbi:hypothetical protein GT037_008831 [Alternaria burnsii]|uniref:Uncharacterized protein n=1 Tax=Alternaria burnsii TaxID=1187904 RepID=A0A8H7EBY3_9PLEO|nr:uncharacterized protein GT037_008831 [Alternaria burnsii]KAF7672880.1 hypothetical protein GT037_008831 [Alternaria burnsii]